MPTAALTWAAVRPRQAGGSAVTVTCCLMADSPNWTHDSAEAREVAEPGTHALQVADSIPVAVGKAAHVQLVDRGAPPPVIVDGYSTGAGDGSKVWHDNLLPVVRHGEYARRSLAANRLVTPGTV